MPLEKLEQIHSSSDLHEPKADLARAAQLGTLQQNAVQTVTPDGAQTRVFDGDRLYHRSEARGIESEVEARERDLSSGGLLRFPGDDKAPVDAVRFCREGVCLVQGDLVLDSVDRQTAPPALETGFGVDTRLSCRSQSRRSDHWPTATRFSRHTAYRLPASCH
jgi:hypothetical protein